jgi:hypothetical protein
VIYGVASFSSWSKSLYEIPRWGLRELDRGLHKDHCLLSKVNTLNGRGQASQHLSSQGKPLHSRQTLLVENLWFTRILHYD